MNEIQIYKKLYGDLVYCIPHYNKVFRSIIKVDAGFMNHLFQTIKEIKTGNIYDI